MKLIRRTLFAVGAAAMLLSPAAVSVANAAPTTAVGGGSGIVISGKYLCTMTTVGHDRSGNLVGLTAGHCGNLGSPISLERNRGAGTIGRIVTKSKSWDVAVIRLDSSRVRPVRSVGPARISRVGTYPQPFSNVCKSGRTTGYTCGPTLVSEGATAFNYVCAAPGDSGGPIISNGRVVGMLNGALTIAGPGTSIECVHPALPIYTPMVATKMTDIVKVLNRTTAVGSGFRPV
ncbi:MAG: S1 family peptidase [Gordonia sp. (in: high G+C Gram-positive bacteria)]